MTHYDAILNHIKADAPCSINHVIRWANSQGFGGTQMVNAIQALVRDDYISLVVDAEEDSLTVELLKD
jgi:hypothetical protein